MRALLIVKQGIDQDFKVIVRLETKALIRRVKKLLEEAKSREALAIFYKAAQVEDVITSGQKMENAPELIFVKEVNR